MGVQGLWQLIESVGRPVSLETLENKTLAIDVSIWLNQAVKGFRDSHGQPLQNAHLLGLFHRICKLLFYKIKPVFVFDGGVPTLKKQTLAVRHHKRSEASAASRNAIRKLLSNYLKSQLLSSTQKEGTSKDKVSPKKSFAPGSRIASKDADLFKLPPLPESAQRELNDEADESGSSQESYMTGDAEEYQDLTTLDTESDDFMSLPPEIRHELLVAMKENHRRYSWARLTEMPEDSHDFSSYQMSRLIRKRKLQQKIEETQQEMNLQTSGDVLGTYDMEKEYTSAEARCIVSEDHSHYILIKGLKKKEAKTPVKEKDNDTTSQITSSSSKKRMHSNAILEDSDLTESKADYKISSSSPSERLSTSGSIVKHSTGDVFPTASIKEIILDKENEKSQSEESSFCDVLSANVSSVLSKKQPNAKKSTDKAIFVAADNPEVTSIPFLPGSSVKSLHEKNNGSIDELSKAVIGSRCDLTESVCDGKNQNVSKPTRKDHDVIISSSSRCSAQTDENHIDLSGKDQIIQFAELPHSEKRKSSEELILIEEMKKPRLADQVFENDQSSNSTKQDSSGYSCGVIEVMINPSSGPDDDLFPADIFCIKSSSPDSIKEPKSAHTSTEKTVSKEADTDEEMRLTNPADEDDDSIFEMPSKIDIKLSEEEISNMRIALDEESYNLTQERGRKEREALSVGEYMYQESQELLKLFGIPYVVSPMEAEAQCAQLENLGLTHGTVTDDSDIWLFGGKKVYKNFFTQGKFVEFFKITDLKAEFGLDQGKLIALAMLTGSDYTEGVEGIGPVTAMEIFSEFPGEGIEPLVKFRDWMEKSKSTAQPPGSGTRAKLLKFDLTPGFPNRVIFDAYLHPEVDMSCEKFTWGVPNLDGLRSFAGEKLGWSRSKIDELLLPVLKKAMDSQTQLRIDSFFSSVKINKEKNLFPSKRVQRALKKMNVKVKEEDSPNIESKPSTTSHEENDNTKKNSRSKKGRGRKSSNSSKGRGKSQQAAKSKSKPAASIALSEESSDSS